MKRTKRILAVAGPKVIAMPLILQAEQKRVKRS